MKICLRGLVAAAVLGMPAMADARDDAQLWSTAAATVKLSDHWRFSEEVVARFSDDRNGLYEIEANSLLGYRIGKAVTVWAGYTHDPNYSAGHFTVMEHRGREQISFDNFARIGPAVLSARLRMEERWRDGMDGTGWRLRPYVKLSLPLGKQGGPALVLSHESFVDLNDTSFQSVKGYDRMRNLVAIALPVVKHATAEVGFLSQHGFVPNGDDTNDNAASFTLNFSF